MSRLPLPVAKLALAARNARSPKERHDIAYAAWEASIRLAAAATPVADANELARPSIGDFVNVLLLGDAKLGDANLLRAHGLLTEVGLGKRANPKTVTASELLRNVATYRNEVLGHGAPMRGARFYDQAAETLLGGLEAAWTEGVFFTKGERLVFAESIELDPSGARRARLVNVTGLAAAVESFPSCPESVLPGRLYAHLGERFRTLHPWVLYDPEGPESVLFFNGRRRDLAKYLDYVTARSISGEALEATFPQIRPDLEALFEAPDLNESEEELAPIAVPQLEPAAPPRRAWTLDVRGMTRPELEVAGAPWSWVLDASGRWTAFDAGGRLHPTLAPLPPVACAALDGQGGLVVGLYDRALVRLRDGGWEFVSRDAGVLSIASTLRGLALGDASGRVALLRENGPELEGPRVPEPIVDLVGASDYGIALLGARGTIWLTTWREQRATPPEPVDLGAFGPAFGLFPTGTDSIVGVIGASSLGLLDAATGLVVAASDPIPDGIRQVVALPRVGGFAVLDDAGEIHALGGDLSGAQPVRLPERRGEAVGIRAGADGRLVAWTRAGELFRIGPDRAVRKVASEGVVLAWPDGDATIVVHLTGAGAQVSRDGAGA